MKSMAELPQTGTAVCSAVGPQNVAVILAEFPGGPRLRITPAAARDLVFGSSTLSANAWYSEASYGRVSLTGQVFGPYTLDRTYTCKETDQMRASVVRAADRDIDFSQFQRYLLIFPPISACSFGGQGSLGCADFQTNDGLVRASWTWLNDFSAFSSSFFSLLIHEIGHNLGVGHSRMLRFPGTSIEADDFRAVPLEYGDQNTVMGSDNLHDFTAAHKVILGWIDPSDVAIVEGDGDFVLAPLASASGIRALRVRRRIGADEWLWLEYRPNPAPGSALIRRETESSGVVTDLIDVSPAPLDELRLHIAPPSEAHPELPPMATWSDPNSDLTITLGEATLDGLPVSIRYGDRCAVPERTEIRVSRDEQEITLAVSAAPECTWDVQSGRSWLNISRSSSNGVSIQVSELPGLFPRSGYVTIGRTAVRITQQPEPRETTILSVSPRTGGWPVDYSAPFLVQLRDENGVADVQALRMSVTPRPGSAIVPCFFRVSASRSDPEVSDDGASFRDSDPVGAATSGSCVLRGGLFRLSQTDMRFRGSLRIGAALGDIVDLSLAVEDSEGAVGPWQAAAEWRGAKECIVLPEADWNAYFASGVGDDSIPILLTASPCSWTANTDVDWIRLKVASSAQGPAPRFEMDRNLEPTGREGRIFVNGSPVRLVQFAEPEPYFVTLQPTETIVSSLGGIALVSYRYGLAYLPPSYSSAPWIRIRSMVAFGSRRELEFEFDPNPDPTARLGMVWIGGKPVTVYQVPAVASSLAQQDSGRVETIDRSQAQ